MSTIYMEPPQNRSLSPYLMTHIYYCNNVNLAAGVTLRDAGIKNKSIIAKHYGIN